MNEELFVTKLLKLKPNEGDLKNQGFSKEFISRLLNGYLIKKKNINIIINNDWLIERLFIKYDISNVEIGHITFLESLIYFEQFIHFGTFDLFRLALDINTGKIIILDEFEDYICGYCAEDESCFFKALIEVEKHFMIKVFNQDLKDDQSLICKSSIEISKIAGGNQYLNFYKNLLGCFF